MVTNRPSIRPGQNSESETKKVSEVSETILSEKEKTDFKDVLLTLEEAEKLQLGKLTVEELSRLQTEQLKESIPYSPEQLRQRIGLGEKDAEVEGKQAENLINELRTSSGEKAKEIKEKVGNIGENIKEGGIMVWLEKAAKEGGIMGFFAGLILGIAKMFGFNNKLGEAKEGIEGIITEKLSEEKIKETKLKIRETIVGSLGENITQQNKQKIDLIIENLNEEQLSKLSTKIQSGELNLIDITNELPNIFNEILDEAQIEQVKEELKNKIINTLKKEIKENYNIDLDLDEEKLGELNNLISSNLRINEQNISKIKTIVENKEFRYKDLEPIAGEMFTNGFNILFGLFNKGIIPTSAFLWDFASNTGDIIKIAAGALGLSSTITLESFLNDISKKSSEEKGLLIGMLYRKGGLFLNILGSISESASKLTIGAFTNSTVGGIDLFSASATNNFTRQASQLDRISRALDPSKLVDHNAILREAIENINKVQENYKIINILQQADGDTVKALNLFKNANITIPNNIISNTPFPDLVSSISQKNIVRVGMGNKGYLTSTFGYGASADLYRLNQKLETISSAQRRMFNPNFLTNGYLRIKEAFTAMNISRMGDRLAFHFNSPDAAKTGIKKLNVLANRFPELLKGTFDKLPIITVAGLAIHSEGPFFEEMRNNMSYLLPIVGPVLMLRESGWTFDSGLPMPIDPIAAGIGGALLTLDLVLLTKETGKHGVKGFGGYLVKPLRDIYSIGKGTLDLGYSVSKAAVRGGSLSQTIRESVKRSSNIKNGKVRALAIIGLAGWAGISYALSEDDKGELNDILLENGEINYNILQETRERLTDNEKEELAKVIILNRFEINQNLEGLDIRVINNKLIITSTNEQIQDNWITDSEIIEVLALNSEIGFIYKG